MPQPPSSNHRTHSTLVRRAVAAGALVMVLLATGACSGSGDRTSASNDTTSTASPVPLVAVSLPNNRGTVQLPTHLADLLGSSDDLTGGPATTGPAAPPVEPSVAGLSAGLTVHHLHYGRAAQASATTLPPERSTAIYLTIFDGEIPVDHVAATAGADIQQLELNGLPAYLYTGRQGTTPVVTVLAWTPVPGHSVVLTGRGVGTPVLLTVAESLRLN